MIIIRLFSRSLSIRANHNNSWPVNRRNNLSSFAYIRLNLIMCVCLKVDKDFLPDSEWRWRDNQEMTSAGTDQEISETSLYPKMIIIASGWPIIMTSNRSRLQIVTKGDLFPLNKSPQTESNRKRNRWWTQHGTGWTDGWRSICSLICYSRHVDDANSVEKNRRDFFFCPSSNVSQLFRKNINHGSSSTRARGIRADINACQCLLR